MKIKYFISISLLVLVSACAPQPEVSEEMVDSGKIYDLANYPLQNLISERIPTPTEAEKNIPVVIAAHGYTATTFEWDELREYADAMPQRKFNVSQVLLGGHGRSLKDFKAAGWKDWQSSIIEEYRKLEALGFKKIYLIGSSTGCPLIINMLASGQFDLGLQPQGIYLIDPIVVSSNKLLTLVSAVGPILGYKISDLKGDEIKHWYYYRPYQSLQALMDLIDLTRKDLQKGVKLPKGTRMKTYKTIYDDAADPVSAVLIYKGIKNHEGSNTEVEMVNSSLHVFTRLRLREGVSQSDYDLQKRVFDKLAGEFR